MSLFFKSLILSIGLIAISGCSIMPSFGPSSDDIVKSSKQADVVKAKELNLELIDVSLSTLPQLANNNDQLFSSRLINQGFLLNDNHVVPGDVISVRLWESAENGLFSTLTNKETSFDLEVSNTSIVNIPYAGELNVKNKSLSDIRLAIIQKYRGKAIDPEIHLRFKNTTSKDVTIQGFVLSQGKMQIPSNGIRLLDLIAQSGGATQPKWELDIKHTRGGLSESISLESILHNSKNNIVILPGDAVYVSHSERKFAVYGAVNKPGNVAVNKSQVSLSDLIAESGGLDDLQAEAASVFIFRPNLKRISESKAFKVDFSKADAFILASNLQLIEKDIVFVGSADASEFRKTISIIFSPFFGSVNSVNKF